MLFFSLIAIIAFLTSSLAGSEFIRCAPQDTPQEYYDGLASVIAYEQALPTTHKEVSGTDEVHVLNNAPRPAIDVYFHVMWDWSDDFITEATFQKQFSILRDFFEPLGFEFTLAKIIYYSERVYAKGYEHREMAKKYHVGSYSTHNVFFVERLQERPSIFGRSTLPLPDMTSDRAPFRADCVIISVRALPGFSLFSEYKGEEGKTLLHETGHWLGLEHIYYRGCDPDFVEGGDRVKDTPPQAYGFYECFTEGSVIRTCPGDIFPANLITNVMDNVPDQCMESFTPGQVARMKNMYWLMRHNKPSSPPK